MPLLVECTHHKYTDRVLIAPSIVDQLESWPWIELLCDCTWVYPMLHLAPPGDMIRRL